jgi:dihydrofolate reductase
MKVILSIAISANGLIATTEGSEDFLSHDNWLQFVKLAKRVGCFIWGRKTYEAVLGWEGDYLKDLKGIKKVVVSHSQIKLGEDFTLASSPEDALAILDKAGFSEAIITGGATLNSVFAKRNLIDEVILDVNPVILGNGLQVFAPESFLLKMTLLETTKISENVFELHYKVNKD